MGDEDAAVVEWIAVIADVGGRIVPAFVVFGLVGLGLAVRRKGVEGPTAAGRKAPGYLLLNVIFLGAMLSPGSWRLFPLLLALLGFQAAREIGRAWGGAPDGRARAALAGLGWVYVPAGLVALFGLWRSLAGGQLAAFLYLCVAAHDAFAQLLGARWGRRPLARGLSPGKTVEGAVGGLGAAVLMALALAPVPAAAALGLGIGVAALVGDLVVSAVKRAAGLKDFGGLLGPQGGVLDRIDGLLLAAVAGAVGWGLMA